jgi:fructokinase
VAQERFFAGVELGGTKSIGVLAREAEIVEQVTLPTSEPSETLGGLSSRLREWASSHPLSALGIASFGPIRLDASAREYGRMHATPKPCWSNAPVAEALTAGLDCPWLIDTDVNGAALAEYRWGAGRGTNSLCYVTVGTGVGGGLVIGDGPCTAPCIPEIGHLRLRRLAGDPFAGACRFHGDCIEGLISGPALAERFGCQPAQIPDQDSRWEAVASDIAELAGHPADHLRAAHPHRRGRRACPDQCCWIGPARLLVERQGAYLPFLDAGTAEAIAPQSGTGRASGPTRGDRAGDGGRRRMNEMGKRRW